MMIRQNFRFWLLTFFLSAVLFAACDDESSNGTDAENTEEPTPAISEMENSDLEISNDQLLGYWEVLAATRNGKRTESLKDAYFNFQEDGQMETNILGEPLNSSYELSGTAITQSGPPKLTYNIKRFEDSLMVLSSQIQSFKFQFQLKLGEEEPAEEEDQEEEVQ